WLRIATVNRVPFRSVVFTVPVVEFNFGLPCSALEAFAQNRSLPGLRLGATNSIARALFGLVSNRNPSLDLNPQQCRELFDWVPVSYIRDLPSLILRRSSDLYCFRDCIQMLNDSHNLTNLELRPALKMDASFADLRAWIEAEKISLPVRLPALQRFYLRLHDPGLFPSVLSSTFLRCESLDCLELWGSKKSKLSVHIGRFPSFPSLRTL